MSSTQNQTPLVWKVAQTVPTSYVSKCGRYVIEFHDNTALWYARGDKGRVPAESDSAEMAQVKCENAAGHMLEWLVAGTMATKFVSECGNYVVEYDVDPRGAPIWKCWSKDGCCALESQLVKALSLLNHAASSQAVSPQQQ